MWENPALKAFRGGHYMQSMSVGDQMLIDDAVFVQKPTGRSRYLFTIEHSGKSYGVYEYYEEGYIYITHNYNPSCNFVAVFGTEITHKTRLCWNTMIICLKI